MALKHMVAKYQGELTTAKEVSNSYRTPFDVTSKVMQTMAQKGLLKSEQGAYGGYLVLRDLSKVSVLDLIQMVEGPVAIAKCLHEGPSSCELSRSCNIVSPVNALNEKVVDFYKTLTVLDLIEPAQKRAARPPRLGS